jgi:hypothetical protein
MCKGCSLEIGNGFRGAVVRQDGIEKPSTWLASVNAAYLGEYLDRNTAMARVEKDIEPNMEMVLHDWGALAESAGAAPDQQGQRSSMASRETSNASEDLDRRQFLVTAALTAAASCDVLGSAEKAGSLIEARPETEKAAKSAARDRDQSSQLRKIHHYTLV